MSKGPPKKKLEKTDDVSATKSGITGGVAGNAKNAARYIVKQGGGVRVDGAQTATQAGKGVFTGGVAGAARNAARYIIKQGGTRAYNGVNIFDKTVRNAKGNPRWFARVDYATIKNPQAHINVNRAVTGLKDPHIPLSNVAAQNTAIAGKALNVLNKAAPVLTAVAIVYDGYQIGKNVMKDKENGSTRNTTQKVMTTAATWGGGFGGGAGGAAIGTAVFPGVGTLIGGIIGGVVGGIGSSITSEIATNAAMDSLKYGIENSECRICLKIFECRKYETGIEHLCEDCRQMDQKISGSMSEKTTCEKCGVKIMCSEGSESQKLCDSCNGKPCSWCGTPNVSLEKVELEEGLVELCEVCMEALKKEIEGILAGEEEREEEEESEESFESWNCKNCGVTLLGTQTPEGEDDLTVLCVICRENEANEILLKKEVEEEANITKKGDKLKSTEENGAEKLCSLCGSPDESFEEVPLEEEEFVEICKNCVEVLTKEIEWNMTVGDEIDNKEDEVKKEENFEAWICKKCGTSLQGAQAPKGEDDLTVLCAICRENEANEILLKKEVEESPAPKRIKSFSTKTCKWCDKTFFCNSSKENMDFCPECEALRPKKGK